MATALSLYCTVDFYGKQIELNKAQKNAYQIEGQELRFGALKRQVGPGAVAGYISDVSDPGTLLSAQHALAPVMLVDNVPYQFVVGNFSRPMDYAAFGREHKLVLVNDFGNRVTLFRKAD